MKDVEFVQFYRQYRLYRHIQKLPFPKTLSKGLIFGTHVCVMCGVLLVCFDYPSLRNKVVMVAFARLLGWPSYSMLFCRQGNMVAHRLAHASVGPETSLRDDSVTFLL